MISEEQLKDACKDASNNLVFKRGGWLDQVTDVISNLDAPQLNELPVVYKQLALINTLLYAVSIFGMSKNLTMANDVLLKTLNITLDDIKNRISQHTTNLEGLLKSQYMSSKEGIIKSLSNATAEMVGGSSDSFLNQVIIPGVLFVGAKRLDQISGPAHATLYCNNLLELSGIFDIKNSTEKGLSSVSFSLSEVYIRMSVKLQQVYNAVYQPIGLGNIVYSVPGVDNIERCISKFDESLCRGKNNRETVANGHIRIKNGINTLLLNAWYLEVKHDEGTVIQAMRNPPLISTMINSAITNNMLAHLDELVDEQKESIAWRQAGGVA